MKNFPLDAVLEFARNGLSVKQSKGAGGLPITRIETISDGSINPEKVGFAGLNDDDAHGKFLKDGDILFSHINSVDHIGKCAIYNGKPAKLVHGMNLLNLRCARELVDPDYLLCAMKSPLVRNKLLRFVNRAVNQASISGTNLKTVEIPLPHKNGKPDLDEQKRIAAILDKADGIRRKRQQALRLTDDFLRSVFLDMFGDPVTNPMGRKTVGLFDSCELTSGATPSKARKDFWDGATPWISPKDMKMPWLTDSIDHISEAALEETNIKLLKPNTVLIVIRGMILAHSFPIAQPLVSCTINQDMKGLTPKSGFEASYLAWSLRCQFANIMTKISTAGHGTRRLDNDSLRSLPILKAEPTEQKTFAKIVEKCRSLENLKASALGNSDEVFSSLQQRAFRGEL